MKSKKILSLILMQALIISCFLGFEISVRANALTLNPTDVSVSSDGCVLLAADGEYCSQKEDAIDLINSYRLEACREGINGYTINDYVPLQWSDDLEYIARIRAAESSFRLAHTRTNGQGCFKIKSPSGVASFGECLVWCDSKSMVDGIKVWYSEKIDLVNKTGNTTGHYEQLIDPSNKYVGLGLFYTEIAPKWNSCVSAEFSPGILSSTQNYNMPDKCSQILEFEESQVKYAYPQIKSVAISSSKEFKLTANVCCEAEWDEFYDAEGLKVCENVEWKSSNPSIASVSDGIVKGIKEGTVFISAYINNKQILNQKVNVIPKIFGDLNEDGSVNSIDATSILVFYANSIAGKTESVDKLIADANKDGKVDSKDATQILIYYANILAGKTTQSFDNYMK